MSKKHYEFKVVDEFTGNPKFYLLNNQYFRLKCNKPCLRYDDYPCDFINKTK